MCKRGGIDIGYFPGNIPYMIIIYCGLKQRVVGEQMRAKIFKLVIIVLRI